MTKHTMYFSTFLLVCLLFGVKSQDNNMKDAIGFPEVDENLNTVNKQNRNPVFLPSRCKENELYYPGDQPDDWICDCRPGYLYHPETDSCWMAFRRGPCRHDEFLVLPTNSIIPECEKNPCKMDSLVSWNGKCEPLGSTNACGDTFPPVILWVNATTISLECLVMDFDFRFSDIAPKICPPGCRRSVQNKCRPGSPNANKT
ncbi:uncharacterized protein LOC126970270 [Leptidea sinapis]|uniref:uncharacterized protein LOC126970270 n=1 Tax=Leptidea sinapis TaxID=189913 RepID=UPI00212CCD88|nr:uncharacterized protein LOC126970270 [Leptidea sinapis]